MEDKIKSSPPPKVTVIIPAYNRALLLPRTIKSILTQTFKNFELIIVNDASPDNTEEVIKGFLDKRIVYIKHQKNRGLLGALNSGLDRAKGEYLIVISDDDEFLPDALETIVNKFADLSPRGVKILWFDCIDAETGHYSGSGLRKEGYVSYKSYLCNEILGDYWIALKREIIGKNRFEEQLWSTPSILYLKLHRQNKAYYIPKVIGKVYREHRYGRISLPETSLNHINRVALTEKAFLKEHGKEIRTLCPNLKYYSQRLAGLAFYQILDGQKREGRKNLVDSLKCNFSLKYGLFFLLTLVLNKKQLKFLGSKFFKFSNFLTPLKKFKPFS